MDIDAGQGSRDRGVPFGASRMFLEGRRRHIGDRGFRVEINPVDGPPTVALFEMGPRRGVDAFDSDARIGQLKRQRHRKAAGMGCAEQLLRVGALAFTHARAEVVWTVKCAVPNRIWPEP